MTSTIPQAYLDPHVQSLAAMVAAGDKGTAPVLADALEAAGLQGLDLRDLRCLRSELTATSDDNLPWLKYFGEKVLAAPARLAKERADAEQARRERRFARTTGKAVRAAAGAAGKSWPLAVIDGDSEPEVVGESYRWETPGGQPVRFPNAYRRAFGKPVYIGSTIRVEVGRGWLKAQGLKTVEEC